MTLRGIDKTCFGARKRRRVRKGGKSSRKNISPIDVLLCVLDHFISSPLCYSIPVLDTYHLLDYFNIVLLRN